MSKEFPVTPHTLLHHLKGHADQRFWEESWRRFTEIYYPPIRAMIQKRFQAQTGQIAQQHQIEDIATNVIADFHRRDLAKYDQTHGRLRGFLSAIIHYRVADYLRQNNQHQARYTPLDSIEHTDIPQEDHTSNHEQQLFHQALLKSLIEDLRSNISARTFEIYERVKLKYHNPEQVANDLGITTQTIYREINRASDKIKTIAKQETYQNEYRNEL